MSWQERAEQLTGTKDYIYQQLKSEGYEVTREEVRNLIPKHPTETVTIGADGTTSEKVIKGSAEDMRKADFLLQNHGFAPNEWELVSARSSMWDAQTPQGVEPLYSSRITVRPKNDITEQDTLEHFIKQAEKYSPVKRRDVVISDENIFVINISDLHLGQLSWGKESGKNYDSKIASENFENLILDALGKSPYKNYEKIYFVIGNDFFNTDTVNNTTTAGTQQTNDVRWQKMFDIGCDLLVSGLERIRSRFPNAPIETLLVPGNHDSTTIYHASKYLYAWYRNDTTMTIDISPRLHKGFAYGTTALLFTHGQAELKNLDWVYTEFRNLIGSTKVTEIHAGHQHRIRVEEKNGALIRVNPTPAALDNWSYGQGYGSTAQTISRIYNRKKGLEYEVYSRV